MRNIFTFPSPPPYLPTPPPLPMAMETIGSISTSMALPPLPFSGNVNGEGGREGGKVGGTHMSLPTIWGNQSQALPLLPPPAAVDVIEEGKGGRKGGGEGKT